MIAQAQRKGGPTQAGTCARDRRFEVFARRKDDIGMTENGPVRRKAVIVEDDALIADDLAAHLDDLGYEVCGVTASPVEAMELLNQFEPDVVTLDINLGGAAEGLAVAIVLRTTAKLPMVFVTGSASEGVTAEIKDFEASALVRKPFTKDALAAGIEQATRRGAESGFE